VSYSDSCGGQNKNLTILGMLSDLHLANVYQSVDHIYLERGHTYLKNDRDFGIIEKRKQTAEVYIPSQWYQVVREASLKKPFQVEEMHRETSSFSRVPLHRDMLYRKKIAMATVSF